MSICLKFSRFFEASQDEYLQVKPRASSKSGTKPIEGAPLQILDYPGKSLFIPNKFCQTSEIFEGEARSVPKDWTPRARNTNWGGRLSAVDLLCKVACFMKKENNIFNMTSNWSKQGGQLYLAFPFSKTYLPRG